MNEMNLCENGGICNKTQTLQVILAVILQNFTASKCWKNVREFYTLSNVMKKFASSKVCSILVAVSGQRTK